MELYRTSFEKNLGVFLFLIGVVVALFTFKDYGVSWDERTQQITGLKNYEYVFSDNKDLLEWVDRDYGVAFELPLMIIEKAFKLTDSRDIILLRHLLTHLFFLLGAFFFFKLVDLLFKNKILATIGFFLIVMHPRLYGHSFFNTKDIPFLSLHIIAFYQAALFFRKKTYRNAILLGIVIGLLINIRLMGVMIFCMVLFFYLLDGILGKRSILHWKLGLVFISFSIIGLACFWPFLWTDPIGHFVEAFENMSKFRWEGANRFAGETILSTKLPWQYIPVWFLITTPLPYLIVGLLSILFIFFQILKYPKTYFSNTIQRNYVLYLTIFFAPIIIVIYLQSVLYDGWRQMYFIYPSFAMFIIFGLNYFLKQRKFLVIVLSFLAFSFVGFFMGVNYPNQHVYFNRFAEVGLENNHPRPYELDYWGISYKQALEYILEIDHSDKILVHTANQAPGKNNLDILPQSQRSRIQLVPLDEATYFVTVFRDHPDDYDYPSMHRIIVDNMVINEIFKLK